MAACPLRLYVFIAYALVLRVEGAQASRSRLADALARGMRGAMVSKELASLAVDEPESNSEHKADTNETPAAPKDGDPVSSIISTLAQAGGDGKKMTDLYGVKMNSEGDTEALISAIAFNTIMLLLTFAIFSGLRACLPAVYSYRLEAHADTGGPVERVEVNNGLFGWIRATFTTEDSEIVEKAGLDSYMLLEFCRLMQRLLLVVTPVVVGALCPLHYFVMKPDYKDFLSRVGFASVIHMQDPWLGIYYVHAGMVWFVVVTSIIFINRTHQNFLKQRFLWLSKVPEPRCTTLLVDNIPPEYRSDVNLKTYLGQIFGENSIERTYVVRKTGTLRGMLQQLEYNEGCLKRAREQWDADGCDPQKKPKSGSFLSFSKREDAIEKYTFEVEKLNGLIFKERTRIEDAACSTTTDPEVCASCAFVTFTSLRWCRLASREQLREDTRQLALCMPPDPVDVLYEKLEEDPTLQKANNLLAYAMVACVFIFWTPLVATTSALTSLNNLKQYSPTLAHWCETNEFLNTLLQGLLATFALKFLMSMLPTVLMFIICRLQYLRSGRSAQLRLQKRYFAFQITFVVFVVTVGQSLSRTLEVIRQHPDKIFEMLASSLPDASHFYLNYVLLGWFTVAMELLRAYQCASFVFCTKCWKMSIEEARAMGEPEDQDGSGQGARFAKLALIMTLSIVFSTVTPFIALTGVVYFTIAIMCYRYLFLFAETKKPDLGGIFWLVALDQIFFALCLFAALMIGILNLNKDGRYAGLAVAPVFLVLYLAYRRLGEFNWETLPFEEIAKICDKHMDEKDKRSTIAGGIQDDSSGEYIQSECRADAAKLIE